MRGRRARPRWQSVVVESIGNRMESIGNKMLKKVNPLPSPGDHLRNCLEIRDLS